MKLTHRITEVHIIPARTLRGAEAALAGDRGGAPADAVRVPRQVGFRCDSVLADGGREIAVGSPHRGTVEVAPDRPGSGVSMEAFLAGEVVVAEDGTTMSLGAILAAAGLSLE